MGLSSVSSMVGGDEPVNALAKIRSLVPADTAEDIEVKANQICIDLSPWTGNENLQPYLEMIRTALQENRLLAFEYADRYGNKTSRTAEPCQLVLKNSQWYCQGYCLKRNDFRLFRLSRMSGLQILKESFSPREYPRPQLDFADTLTTMQIKIKIRIHKSVIDRVIDFCAYEHFTPDGDDHYIIDFPFLENDFYYGILLSLGDKCECLEPVHIRAEMKRRIHAIAALYEN